MKRNATITGAGPETSISRRSFLKGALAFGALASAGGMLAACAEAEQPTPPAESEPTAEPAAPEPEPLPEPSAPAAAGSTLVVYFSATGNTGRAAQAIADARGADMFAITPSQPYTDADLNWRDESSRVCAEHDDPAGRHVQLEQAQIPGLDAYGTVFFGYPTWWQQASWVVDDVAVENDFTGKTVIPFTTSSSSPLGDSASNLAALAGTGDWREGMRFPSSVSAEDVAAWLDGLDA